MSRTYRIIVILIIVIALSAIVVMQFDAHPSLAYRLGIRKNPNVTVARSNTILENGILHNRYSPEPVRWTYAPAPNGLTPVATIFSLHGLGGSDATTFDTLHIADFVANKKLPFAVASLSGGISYWHQRKNGTDMQAVLREEFVRMIEQKTHTSQRFLLGWSMGAYGSLLVAGQHPGMFAGVVAISPALWTDGRDSAPGAYDDLQDFTDHDVFVIGNSLRTKPIFIDCGKGDPFASATKQFAKVVPHATVRFREGNHDDAYFRSAVPDALEFMNDHITSDAKKPVIGSP